MDKCLVLGLIITVLVLVNMSMALPRKELDMVPYAQQRPIPGKGGRPGRPRPLNTTMSRPTTRSGVGTINPSVLPPGAANRRAAQVNGQNNAEPMTPHPDAELL